ncbi:hypothetical protein EJB05_11144 [Eragrostis curvula]|uniref:CG-1 domain-containing protein n=1 Tax=Eragrostis curvula TaxID=38414 RepID=A0A5J9VPT8_9POAL|nr:hypothetical protein EJB05_11144 [Eragrostis curvula]
MAEIRKYPMSNQPPDISQILLEAQNRWLRPTEICQILSNYKKFSIAPEPPNRPPSGSLFLFDRKILRYFRKDGHNWRKKKDGKTVKEAHEKLKVGSVDVLHCYYAHGEDNSNFQRRTYWLLDEGFMNIVLVHYLEVKGGKENFSRAKEAEEIAGLSNADSPACSNSFASQSQVASQTMDAESPISGQISEYEDAETGLAVSLSSFCIIYTNISKAKFGATDNCRASSRYHPFTEMQQPVDGIVMDNLLGASVPSYLGHMQPSTANLNNNFVSRKDISSVFNGPGAGLRGISNTPMSSLDSVQFGEPFPEYASGFMEPTLYSSVATMESNNLDDSSHLQTFESEALYTSNLTQKEADALTAAGITSSQAALTLQHPLLVNAENDMYTDRSVRYPLLKQSSLDLFKMEPDGLKKFDSFSRWMSSELAEVVDLDIKSSSDAFWSTTETVNAADGSSVPINEQLDAFVVSPSLSQDQLFSIIDVSPSWAYAGSKAKVLITGTFLANKEYVEKCRWSCMFGDVEVPAEVLVDGSLRSYTPVHHAGRVPFYVTCSNRVACSEVREFEFRDSETQYMEDSDQHTTGVNEMHLHIRLEKLLSLGPDDYEKYVLSSGNKSELIDTINSLMLDDKFSNLALPSDEKFSTVRDQNLEKLVKEKLYYWLIHKVHDDGKGPNVLGKEGQGVIHLVAALGYDWAIRPIVAAGVNVNFRDIRGWTALHWAASCGRESTVCALIANGAASGALTDPTQQFPSGRTAADLASENGHKGIAGFLAESALTSHLSALSLKESQAGNVEEICGSAAAADFAESSSAQLACVDSEAEPLKDSLSAVRKSTQAAARIFQAFRVESFHRKKVIEYGDDDCGLSDERTLSLVSLKNARPGQGDVPLHSAAVRIQNKFRGWKGRKEFMIIRQKIVKIQAHVRGHQVRKSFRKIVWSVGIVEKVILRWRRKGRGLRGFQAEKLLEGPSQIQPAGVVQPAKVEDEYDFLKDGRKQAERRLQIALDRVHSMTRYPEATEQYHRLRNRVHELQESQEMQDRMPSDSAGAGGSDFMAEMEDTYCDDGDMPMSTIS